MEDTTIDETTTDETTIDVVAIARKLCEVAKEENVYGENFEVNEEWYKAKPVQLFAWIKTLDQEIRDAREVKEQNRPLSNEELEQLAEIQNYYK